MPWLHLELKGSNMRECELTDDDGEVIAVAHNISWSNDIREVNAGFQVVSMPMGSGRFEMEFYVPDMAKLSEAIYGPKEINEPR